MRQQQGQLDDHGQRRACTPGKLPTQTKGTLTVATDKPAYPPYFEDDEPANGEGFESAVAYAIGKQLGYPQAKVKWTVEPFNSSYAPGPEGLRLRRQPDLDHAGARKGGRLLGALLHRQPGGRGAEGLRRGQGRPRWPISRTPRSASRSAPPASTRSKKRSNPSSKPEVFNSSNDVVTALKNEQIDAVVVDLPTALYLTAVQVPTATVVGQFSAPGGDQWGALLAKGSPLTACVSEAVEELEGSGELEQLNKRWMSQAAGAPELH